MKKIVFYDRERGYEFWLDINDILIIRTKPYYSYRQLEIQLKSGFDIQICKNTESPRTFTEENIYDFINSDEKMIRVEVKRIDFDKKCIVFRIEDWITMAMEK